MAEPLPNDGVDPDRLTTLTLTDTERVVYARGVHVLMSVAEALGWSDDMMMVLEELKVRALGDLPVSILEETRP